MPPKQKPTEESAVEIKKNVTGIKKCAICNFGRVQGDNELTNFGGYWKLNKDLKGLGKYIGEYILPVLDTAVTQTVIQMMHILKRKYRRLRTEILEVLVSNWLRLKEIDYEDEGWILRIWERALVLELEIWYGDFEPDFRLVFNSNC